MAKKRLFGRKKALLSLHKIAPPNPEFSSLTSKTGGDYSLVSECFYVIHETPAALLSLASRLPEEASGVNDVPEKDG